MKPRKVFIADVIPRRLDVIEPIIAQFTNGEIRNGENLESALYQEHFSIDSERPKDLKYANTPTIKFTRERLLMTKTSRLTYMGRCDADEFASAGTANKGQTFLGILDKKTNEMKLVQCSTVVLHPVIVDLDAVNRKKLLDNMTKTALKDEFVDKFGGKRAKKRMHDTLENKVDLDTMSGVLSSALKKVEAGDELKQMNTVETYAEIIPPCKRTATKVEDVYSLKSIIDDEYLLLLYDMTKDEYQTEHHDSFSDQLKQTLSSVILISNEDMRLRLTCAAFYCEFLTFLLSHERKNFGRVLSIPKCPKLVQQKIFEEFTTKDHKSRCVKKANGDKLLSYILVLTLLINGFEASLNILLASLGVDKDRFERIIQCVGARCPTDTGLIVLRLPLNTLRVARGNRSKKRK